MFDEDSTKLLEYSYHWSKLSCWKPFYFAHVIFAYMVFLTGVFAFITRLIPRLHFLHIYMGRLYVIAMLWATGTSLLIHNTGTPIGVLWSFLWCLLGLTIGWALITVYQQRRRQIVAAEEKITNRWVLIMYRLLSYKGLHGIVMFVSWINIAGRIFVTPLSADFECFTYPAFKSVDTHLSKYDPANPVKFVPKEDPLYGRLPWAYREGNWAAMLSLGPFFGAMLVGFIYLAIVTKKSVNPEEKAKPVEMKSTEGA